MNATPAIMTDPLVGTAPIRRAVEDQLPRQVRERVTVRVRADPLLLRVLAFFETKDGTQEYACQLLPDAEGRATLVPAPTLALLAIVVV